MEDMLIDSTTISTTDKLCFMILDHLRRAEDNFQAFKSEYLEAKRIEKFNQVMECVRVCSNNIIDETLENYIIDKEYNESDKDNYEKYRNFGTQLALSICTMRLSDERIKSIWNKVFPEKNIQYLLDLWDEDGRPYSFEDHYILVHKYSSLDVTYSSVIKSIEYTESDIKRLIEELSLVELSNIYPIIKFINYRIIKL